MNAQNTHHIPIFYHVFCSFHLVISVFIVVYLILGFSCIAGEKRAAFATSSRLNQRDFF